MTAFQKIIKYFAIALAAVIIVSIVSGITFGIYVAGNVIGLIRSDDSEVLENLEVISGSENASASKLEVELGAMNFYIKKGDEFKVEANKSDVKFEVKDNVAYIKDDTRSGWFNFGSIKGSIVVYIPGESEIFEGVVIKGGAGVINIDDLKTRNLRFDMGAGKVLISNLEVTDEAKIDGGAGKIEILGGTIRDLDLDLGVGKTDIRTKLIGHSEIDAGVGAVNISLIGSRDDYEIKANRGLGGISVDGQDVSDGQTIGNGLNFLKISGGVGSIDVKFGE